jgi:hypothetical protein
MPSKNQPAKVRSAFQRDYPNAAMLAGVNTVVIGQQVLEMDCTGQLHCTMQMAKEEIQEHR